MDRPTLSKVAAAMDSRGYSIFSNDRKPFNLNLVGVRNPSAKVDEFGCWMTAFWKYGGEWNFRAWPWTTLPGSTYLQRRLLNRAGCAILVPGQYRGVYSLDLHNGRYEALCQRRGRVRVYRDGNRNAVFDMEADSVQGGFFGINIHAPVTPRDGLRNYVQESVRGSSAGCQVSAAMGDFMELRELAREARKWFGNSFTYTLLDGETL